MVENSRIKHVAYGSGTWRLCDKASRWAGSCLTEIWSDEVLPLVVVGGWILEMIEKTHYVVQELND